jgi:hypothetical protein
MTLPTVLRNTVEGKQDGIENCGTLTVVYAADLLQSGDSL